MKRQLSVFMKPYDKPCLLHLSHIKAIVEVPELNEGSGKDLCDTFTTDFN